MQSCRTQGTTQQQATHNAATQQTAPGIDPPGTPSPQPVLLVTPDDLPLHGTTHRQITASRRERIPPDTDLLTLPLVTLVCLRLDCT